MDTSSSTLNFDDVYHIPTEEELNFIIEEIQASINKTNQKVNGYIILVQKHKQKIKKLKSQLNYFKEIQNNNTDLTNFDTMKKDTLDTLSKLL
jgi:hypothetical protein